MSIIERMARAIAGDAAYEALPERATYLERKTHPEREWADRAEVRDHLRAALAATRYDDSREMAALFVAASMRSKHAAVRLAEGWNAVIDAALAEGDADGK
jgi:hypothetical protein